MRPSCLRFAWLLGTVLLTSAAGGQNVTHRVTDLGSLSSSGGSSEAFAVNENGQVTGWAHTNIPGSHAFIWLPETALGFETAGMHEVDPGSTLSSVGHGINLEGKITGRRAAGFTDHAFLWQPGAGLTDLGSLAGANGFSEGWDISDGVSFIVVGVSETSEDCNQQGFIHLGFTWQSESEVMAELPAAGETPLRAPNDASRAYTISATGATIGGQASRCLSGEWCQAPSSDAVFWGESATALSQPAGFGDGEGAAFGANNLTPATVAGYGLKRYPEEAPVCRDRALLWTLGDPVTVVNLHTEVMEAPPANTLTHAKAVNDNKNVVGANGDLYLGGDAVLWEFDGENWTYVTLDDRIDSLCGWDLREARDISNAEWIVGWGEHDGVQSAFLLTPLEPCPADIDGNGQVDVQDFQLLLEWWGDCPTGVICTADITADCVVNVQDFLAYLAAFGPCPESGGQSPQPGQGDSGLSLPQAVQLLGFADMEAYVAWASEASETELLASVEILVALLQ